MITLLLATITFGSPDVPAREPQLAVQGNAVALTYGAGNSIYFAASRDSGRTFSSAVKVSEGEIVPLTRHRGPRIVFSQRTIVITAVVGHTAATGPHAHGLPSDGDLMAWRSTDGGTTWSKGVAVNDAPGSATEGLHSLAVDTTGNLFAAWLDNRGKHGTQLYGARSTDGGLTWIRNTRIYDSPDGSICQCCHPSVAIDSTGQILVMWRNWLGGSRDMYLARSKDGVRFTPPEKLGMGTWPLNACPMDGGGIAVDGTSVTTAWRREHQIYLAVPGKPEVSVGQGTDVALTVSSRGTFVIWTTPRGIHVVAPGRKDPLTIAVKGAFPSIAALRDGSALAAWEQEGVITVQPVQ